MRNDERAAMFRQVAELANPVTARIFREIAAVREAKSETNCEWLGGGDGPAREPGEEG